MNFKKRFDRRSSEPLLDLGATASGEPYLVPFSAFHEHGLVIGPTGTGKTRFLQRFTLEVAEKHPDVAQVVISPKGDFAPHLRRECYRRGWRRRVTYIDVSERRRLPGLNVVRPWGDDFLQAKVQREVLARSMGLIDLSETPRLARYAFVSLFAAIAARLTIREAALVLEHHDGGVRQAVIPRLPEGAARRDLERLEQVSQQLGEAGAARFFEDQTSSTLNRLRLMTENPILRLMLGSQRSVCWEELLTPGRIVIVNADQGVTLDREDQRYLVMSMIADIARTCFSRSANKRVRTSLTLDEAGWFGSSVLSDILDRGREYRLSLLSATQYLSQFVDPKTQDRRLLDSVLTDCRTKVVFGGLSPSDARELASLMHEHLLDADKRQLEVRTLRQLHKVVDARSESHAISEARSRNITRSRAWAESESETETRSHTSGIAQSHGRSSVLGEGTGAGVAGGSTSSLAIPRLGGPGGGGMETTTTLESGSILDSAFEADGESESESLIEADSEGIAISRSTTEVEGVSQGASRTRGETHGVTEGPMVQPTEPFLELSSVTIEPLQTQLHRYSSSMVRQPRQHALLAIGKDTPVAFRVADVHEPRLSEGQALTLDLDMMDAHHFFSRPEEIEHEIAERDRALLGARVVEVIDGRSAVARRRAARTARLPEDRDLGGEAGASVLAPVRPRGPRGGRAAARIPVPTEVA